MPIKSRDPNNTRSVELNASHKDHVHAHTALTGVTADQHHARDHAARHAVGGGDDVTIVEAQISDLDHYTNADHDAVPGDHVTGGDAHTHVESNITDLDHTDHLVGDHNNNIKGSRTLPVVANDYVELFSMNRGNGAHTLILHTVVSDSAFSVAKSHFISTKYATPSTYVSVQAISDSEAYNGNDYRIEIGGSTNVLTVRVARVSGTTAATLDFEAWIAHDATQPVTVTPLSGVGASAATSVYQSGYLSKVGHAHVETDITNLDHYVTADFTTDHNAVAGDHITGGDLHDHAGGDGAQIDHGGLAGLVDDDHTQYHNTARHDAHDHSAAAASVAVNDLGDVVVTTPADNEVMAFDTASGTWINQTPAEAALSATGHTHVEADVTNLDHYVTADFTVDHDAVAGDHVTGGDAHTHTESDVTDLNHTDATAVHDNVSGEIAAVAEKLTPVTADLLLIEDSAATNAKKKIQIGNLPSSGVTDHGALTGLADDDHTHYLTTTRHTAEHVAPSGLLISRARETPVQAMTTTAGTQVIGTTITIPATWAGYDLEYYFTTMVQDNSGGELGSGNVNTRPLLAGAVTGSVMINEVSATASQDLQVWSHTDFVEAQTTTGIINVGFAAWILTSSVAMNMLEAILIVKAYRTS